MIRIEGAFLIAKSKISDIFLLVSCTHLLPTDPELIRSTGQPKYSASFSTAKVLPLPDGP